ncbi:MAG: hypothetical protein MO853_03105 [Candidatus Protistobacter heckmanni]|nr:hypothetical protein [Candidatus Protistobacter heckmanni]
MLYPKLPYSPERDLRPVTVMGSFPMILAVNPSVPANSVHELVAMSKKPGQQVTYSTASVAFQVATEMLKQMSGANLYNVPYKGRNQEMMAVLGSDVQMVILDGALLLLHMQSGKLKALEVTSPKRISLYPSLPTVAESGVSGYALEFWVDLFAPAKTPVEIVNKVQAEVVRIMQKPDVCEKLAKLGIEARGGEMIRAEAVRFAAIIKKAGITEE